MPRRLARAVTALVALLALQLVGVGSAAAACVLGSHGPAASGAAVVAPGGGMPGMVMGAGSAAESGTGGALAVPAGGDSCDHDAAPERCMSAPACAAFVPGHAVVSRDVAQDRPPTRVAPLVVLAPPSVTSPPDLRPPRA